MSEKTPKPTPKLIEAQQNVHTAEETLTTTTPLFIDQLLIATGGNVDLVKELMQDVASLAEQAGALAVAKRRENAVIHTTKDRYLHPDAMSPRQDSGLFGHDGAQPIISALDTIGERAKLVAQGASPVQKISPMSPGKK